MGGGDFSLELVSERPGFVCVKISGKKVAEAFKKEPGGHRWQRVPPTEKRGRVHTSTITVVVLPEVKPSQVKINDKDLEWKTTRSGGPGGQHMQKNDTAVILKHKPSGIVVRCETRSQAQNKEMALEILRAKLLSNEKREGKQKRKAIRKKQAGSGMRGDKIRTIRLHAGTVVDHQTGKRMKSKQYLRGFVDELY